MAITSSQEAGTAVRLPAGEDRSTFAYVALLALGVLDAAAYSVIAPVAPTLAAQTGTGPGLIGLLVATFPAGIVIGFALAGSAIRRQRYSALLLLSLGLLAAGSLGFAASSSLPGYSMARFVMGLGSGGLWMGVTFSTLQRWPGQEYLCMSRIFAAYSVGGLLGPAIGALGGVREPFLVYLALVGLAAVLVVAMPPSRRHPAFGSDRSALRSPAFRVASAGILFAVLALGIVEGVLPLHLAARLDQAQIGLLYAAMSLVVAVSAALASRFPPRAMLLGAHGLVVLGIGLAAATGAVPLWIVGLAIGGLGIGMANTGSIGVLLQGVPTERSVTAIVAWSQVGIVGYLLGPLVGGTVAQVGGFGLLGVVLLAAAVPVLALGVSLGRGRSAA